MVIVKQVYRERFCSAVISSDVMKSEFHIRKTIVEGLELSFNGTVGILDTRSKVSPFHVIDNGFHAAREYVEALTEALLIAGPASSFVHICLLPKQRCNSVVHMKSNGGNETHAS